MQGEYIFVSYNHIDRQVVDEFCTRLRSHGIEYFRDVEARNYGRNLSESIKTELLRSTYVVVFLSRRTEGDRDWIAYEAGIASFLRRSIVVRLLDDEVQVPSFLANYRHVRTLEDEERFLALLLGRPLLQAAKDGDTEGLRQFLGEGASVHSTDEEGNTPLIAAVCKGAVECVRLLLASGADVNAGSKDNWSPLHFAALNDNEECASLLLDNGAEINSDHHVSGMMPYDMAKMRGSDRVARLLRSKGGRSRWEQGGRPVDMRRFFPPGIG